MKTTTRTITPISENPKQPQPRQTAKEVIAANVKSLIEQLEAGHSDALTAYLNAMSRFHNYSFGNILEIARQRAVAYCFTSLESMNIRGCAPLETRDGRLVAVRTNLIGLVIVNRVPVIESDRNIKVTSWSFRYTWQLQISLSALALKSELQEGSFCILCALAFGGFR